MKIVTILHKISQLIVPLKRTMSPLEADSYSACGGHFFNRSLLLLLMMLILGVTGIKAQDYSGTYYIGSYGKDDKDHIGYIEGNTETNYYLCPTEGWIYYEYKNSKDDYTDTDNGQPFITSYQCKSSSKDYDATKAEWVITKHSTSEYYYIQQRKTGKYLVFNGKINTASSANRIRVHLEGGVESYVPNDYALFEITTNPANSTANNYLNGAYLFHPKKDTNGYYLNISEGNQDALIGTNAKTDGPTASDFTKYVGGTLGHWNEANNTSSYRFEDVIPAPIITQQDGNTVTISYSGTENVFLYYTTNGDKPDPKHAGGDNPTQIYEVGTTTITMSNPVTTIKAIAVKSKGEGEVLDTYSRCVTLTTQRYIGPDYPYLFQNVECTNFYMIPGDVNSNNTEVNTSSLFRSTMVWTLLNAGSEPGVQYYYIKNGDNYLYFIIEDKNDKVYMKSSSDFDSNDDGYKFSIEQGFDADSKPDGFHIVPKAKSSDNTYCIYKGGWANTTPPTIANSKADVMKGSGNARRPEHRHTRWNFISASGGVLPSSLTYDSNNLADPNWPAFLSTPTTPKYFKIENVGTTGQYMCPPEGAAAVGTAITGNSELAWYVIEAGQDDWRKYYYIVHASTGKYLKFNKTISDPASSMTGEENVLSLLNYDSSASDRYQFVFAKSTVDGEYYIVPKGLEDATYNSYYALYLDETDPTDPIKSDKGRESDSYKWKFVTTLFCSSPVFEETTVGEEKKIIISCNTNAATIHYTDNGETPDANSTLYNPESISWLSTEQHLIKAIAVVSDGNNTTSSSVVILLNKPAITLKNGEDVIDNDTYTYDGTAKTPIPTKVDIGTAETTSGFALASTDPYLNNINAGTATVNVIDNDATDTWYIMNASTTFTINPAPVTVTADDKTKIYGNEDPTLTATIEGLVAGDSESLISYTVSRATGETVGSYTITATGDAAQGNYTVTYLTGILTITKRPVRVISGLTANNKTYDGTTNATLVTTDATFGDGDVLTGDNLTIDSATGTFDTKDVGTGKTVVISGLSLGGTHAGNYELASSGNQTSMTANITPATLSVTANNKTIGYGDAPDNDGVVYGGFVNDEDYDVLGGTLVYSYNSANDGSGTAYTTTSSTGTYYIIPGGLTSGNYTITFVPGTLTVGAKDIGNGTAPADGFSISVGTGSGDSFVVKNGETTLNPGVDYDVNPVSTSASGKYSKIKIQGKGNYQNEFEITKANVDFSTDETGSEWSATFVAEGADLESPDSDKGHALPEGISAYIITAIDGNLAVSESLGYIPEGVPVLLLSNADANGFLVKDASEYTAITTTYKDANMLEEVTETTTDYVADTESPNYQQAHFNVATIYLLYKNEFVLNKDGYLAKGKVYLNPNHGASGGEGGEGGEGGGGLARLKISKGDNTGIENIEYTIKPQSDAWYTLDGRRLSNKPTKKGLYLQGGKKIVVK